MVKGLRSLLYEERLRELDMFSLEEEGLGKIFIIIYQYLRIDYKYNGSSLFTRRPMEKQEQSVWGHFH